MNRYMAVIFAVVVVSLSMLGMTHQYPNEGNSGAADVLKPTSAPEVVMSVAEAVALAVPEPDAPEPLPVGTSVQVHASHYTPWTGGTNCANFKNGKCISRTASGEMWENWVENGVACIKEWAFFTKVIAFGKVWRCVDRGGKIRYDDFLYFDGLPWIDFLTAYPQVKYGELITVEVVK